ncbi:hypothetical protein DUT91_04625 [Phyllobacterium salinisoli]|uniref:Uncharacterized protein n=1 Tax=Phyllobacterium salinisoli TaxID=1899321 RepID=A0A368K803_9HYPH|nr:hypothetical protein DUT91_04625 [Phyllobacterium salinisoli]
MKHAGDSALGRMKAAAKLRAIGVLVRKHPRALLAALSAGIWQAGRVGVQELLQSLGHKGSLRDKKHDTGGARSHKWYSVTSKGSPRQKHRLQ